MTQICHLLHYIPLYSQSLVGLKKNMENKNISLKQ